MALAFEAAVGVVFQAFPVQSMLGEYLTGVPTSAAAEIAEKPVVGVVVIDDNVTVADVENAPVVAPDNVPPTATPTAEMELPKVVTPLGAICNPRVPDGFDNLPASFISPKTVKLFDVKALMLKPVILNLVPVGVGVKIIFPVEVALM